MQATRLDYAERKSTELNTRSAALAELKQALERRLPHARVVHSKPLRVAEDWLQVAHEHLARIQQSDDEAWSYAKRDFEHAEYELDLALRRASDALRAGPE